jgi:hypothetical protein
LNGLVARLNLTGFLAGTANRTVVVIQDDADFVHQANLLLVVALEFSPFVSGAIVGGGEDITSQGGVDFGEKSSDIFGGDLRRSRNCHRSAHLEIAFEKRVSKSKEEKKNAKCGRWIQLFGGAIHPRAVWIGS